MIKDISKIETPAYVVDRGLIRKNLEVLDSVQKRTGCKIMLALKGFAMWSLFPEINKVLCGAAASSADEARLAREEFGGEVHATAAAFPDWEFDELLETCDVVNLNSFSQWEHFKKRAAASKDAMKFGIRVNPGYSEVSTEIYNPCSPHSRLGVRPEHFKSDLLDGITGLHFHVMCEQNSDVLQRVLPHFEKHFDTIIKKMEWVNMGGGHHITRPGYDVDLLCSEITRFWKKYPNLKTIYLEPGEAIALNTGILVSTVLDVAPSADLPNVILDTSAAAHMPDVLEMPYRPNITGAGTAGEYAHTYRLGGLTCLAGDVIGVYSFKEPLKAGDKLVFHDMAHYTMVKNNTFNGVRLPSICISDNESVEIVKKFSYNDFKTRLS
ncbi:MAG: carboxynorspermidine decarboxylase [Fibrobacteres bacterium]|nr:carboxynorspermidine decarboxylase [Fibrobacterota bacterium]